MAGDLSWESVKLGEVCAKIGSGATPRGGQEGYKTNGITLIRSQNVYNDGFRKDGLAFIDETQARQLDNVTVESDDILLNITGDSVARCCQVPSEVLPARVNQHVAIVRPNSRILDKRFLRYFLVMPSMQGHMLALAGAGATRNALTKGMIEQFRVPCPPIEEQTAIAQILGALDDKIELNRRMNETLEAMGRAIFKSWFVDFDPVRAKAEGRQPFGMDAATAALFPNSFQDSEAGEIPTGWRASPVYELATYINGAAYRAFEPNEERRGLPIIKIAELKSGVTAQTRFSTVTMPEKYRLGDGDILFSWSGNPDTSIDTFVWNHGPAWLNQHIFRVVPNSPHDRAFVLMTLRSLRPVFAEVARNKQTTGLGHVTVKDLKRLLIVKPPKSVLLRWNSLVEPLLAQSFSLAAESSTLAAIRDTLLPKLISGEIRVKDAEKCLAKL